MTISVWADVGGTFTDCMVSQSGRRHQMKVLSSGIVRCTVQRIIAPSTLQLRSLPAESIPEFWIGADVRYLADNGDRRPLGNVSQHDGATLVLDRPLDSLPEAEDGDFGVVELVAGVEAPVLAARILLGVPLSADLPPSEVRLGTTRGTNALLTRGGANTALLVTEGFGDVLRISEQDRPDLFSLAIKKPDPLTENVVEVAERIAADGQVLQPLETEHLRRSLEQLHQGGVESLAICLLHAHVNDSHEVTAEALAKSVGFTNVSRSSEVAPLIKLVARAETTTLDAYLNPILAGYLATVWRQFGGQNTCTLRLMTSGGNLVEPDAFRGRDSILSGPAGGVVALGHVAARGRADGAVGLDMGGTSTDVSRYEEQVGRRYESRIAGIRVLTPMMDIETVAAGGGSICDYSVDGRLVVGPDSAGADPGPACYGRGGPLTVTDVNLLLGRIPVARFPFPLRRDDAQSKLREIRQRMKRDGHFVSTESLAEGFLDIAVTHMAEAVRTVSTAKGTDVRAMALVGFGGAAGQHLCRVASALGIRRILDHPDAGMLSALGMGLADIGHVVTRGIYRSLGELTVDSIAGASAELKREADQKLASAREGHATTSYQHECDLRYLGTESSIAVPLQPIESLASRFCQAHHDAFGYAQPERDIELVALRCEGKLSQDVDSALPDTDSASVAPNGQSRRESVSLWHDGAWVTATHVERATLSVGQSIQAPAMIVSDHSTLVVEPGWAATVIDEGIVEMVPVESPSGLPQQSSDAVTDEAADDPVLMEVVARRLQGIADSMGEVLRRTSISVNVKERRDYSCAIFRGDGALVANAPHVPVHLGAMGHTVRHLIEVFPSMSPGDCYLSNDPYAGGSHLPDITLVTPVFCDGGDGKRPDFFVASRAHHAEIGGKTPGSMPPDATTLEQEGVVIRNFPLVRESQWHQKELRQLLSSGRFPSRSVEENLADISAQQAAGARGAHALSELAMRYTTSGVKALMSRLLEVAGDSMGRWIKSLGNDPMKFSDVLDDGTPIGVTMTRRDDRLVIEFEAGPCHPNGFNATPAIVTAAVLYVLRCVADTDLPLCDGVLRDVEIRTTPGLLDPPWHRDPSKCPAVVAGNVETSQRIVDVLLGALGIAAASQGTMNNVLMGDDTFGYYETIGGGSGATAQHDGADAVHTHMTNTRITDPEVLESRLPVRLIQFSVRGETGGDGKRRGGDGIVREFEFLKPLVVSLITSRRTTKPYGMDSGAAGTAGKNTWIQGPKELDLGPTATIRVGQGDRLRIETPGGGGFGLPG